MQGRAREAARLFPQKVNVVAALSLAGIGFDRTVIRMFADPSVKHNTFELHATGEFGEIRLDLRNNLPRKPEDRTPSRYECDQGHPQTTRECDHRLVTESAGRRLGDKFARLSSRKRRAVVKFLNGLVLFSVWRLVYS